MTLRLAWFATAKGTSSRLLFERTQQAISQGALDAEIVVVFCNRERGQSANTDAFLDTVAAAGRPLVTVSSGAWRKRVGGELSPPGQPLAAWRHDFDRAVRERLAPYAPELGLLAGFMLITSEELCSWLPLLNLHPAAPDGPIGTWQAVVRELIASKAGTSGIMTQHATVQLDRGPVVTWCRYPLRSAALDPLWAARSGPPADDEPLFAAIRAEGVKREPPFLLATLGAVAAARVPLPAPGEPGPALDLSVEVEAAVQAAS